MHLYSSIVPSGGSTFWFAVCSRRINACKDARSAPSRSLLGTAISFRDADHLRLTCCKRLVCELWSPISSHSHSFFMRPDSLVRAALGGAMDRCWLDFLLSINRPCIDSTSIIRGAHVVYNSSAVSAIDVTIVANNLHTNRCLQQRPMQDDVLFSSNMKASKLAFQ